VQLGDPGDRRRRVAMGAWVLIAGLAFAKALTTSGVAQFFLIAVGCVMLLAVWVGMRWGDRS
jgi:hypothetical protein